MAFIGGETTGFI